jgi:hypothetical protein
MAGRSSSAIWSWFWPSRVRRPASVMIPPTGKASDLEFGQTTKWDGDQLTVISAFYDAALQRQQIGLA